MSTDERPPGVRRRCAVVLARYSGGPGAPPGIDAARFAAACLADTFEVVADLVGVTAAVAGPPSTDELLWPGNLRLDPGLSIAELAAELVATADDLVLLPADLPDLPGIVLAKLFRALPRADVAVAPEVGGIGCAAVGLALPLASWLTGIDLDLDRDLGQGLRSAAPRRSAVASGPGWHRLRTPGSVHRLDPGLEGWEATRALLSGSAD